MIQSVLRRGQPVWLERNHRPNATRYATLRGHHETDVAIVGGGMTGAMIAALFAEANVKVMVIEAERAGLGSTAASTALLLQEPDYDLTALARKYGPATARRIWQISHDTNREFIDTIHRLRISCRLQPRDSIYYTLNEDSGALRREWTRRQKGGLRRRVAGRRRAAPRNRHSGRSSHSHQRQRATRIRCSPVTGCSRAAVRMGAHVFERSTVNRIRRIGDGVRLYSKHGTIDARQAVIATGYATKYFRPLAGRFKMRHTYVLATEPIGWRIAAAAWPWQGDAVGHRAAVSLRPVDRRSPAAAWRRGPAGEAGREPLAAIRQRHARAARIFRPFFPAVSRACESIARGTACSRRHPMRLPFIGPHRRYPGQTFALGYGGNGMTFAALAARILLEQWRGVTSPDHRLFAFNRIR